VGSRGLLNLALLVMAGGLAAALLLSQPGTPQQPGRLSRLDPATVDHITVERQGQPALHFERRDGGWHMIGPVAIAANPARINAMLYLLRERPRGRIEDPGRPELKTLGLAPAPVTLRLNDQRFALGGTDPVDGLRYVRHRDVVYLLNESLFAQLRQPPAFFVANRLLPAAAGLTQITCPDRAYIRDEQGWHSQSRQDDKAAAVAAAWQSASAQRVLPYRQRTAIGKVVVKTAAEVIVFDLVPSGATLLLARPALGIAYQLTKKTAAALGLDGYIHGESGR